MLWSVATCTWMIDGVVVLGDVNIPAKLYHLYKTFPTNVRKILYAVFVGLFSQVEGAARNLQSFCYEDRSRLLWKQMGGQTPNAEVITGIPGTARLGMNLLQRMWGVYNRVEDQRMLDMNAWQNAKFIASAHAPKGVRQLSNRETARLQQEERRRQASQDNFYYRCIGVMTDEDTLADGRKVTSATKSVSQLQKEYHEWVEGVQDFHDKIVEDYKQEVIDRFKEEQRIRAQEMVQLRSEVSDPQAMQEEMALVGYDLNQIQEILRERRGDTPGARRVYDSMDAKREYIYKEFLTKEDLPPPPGGFTLNREGKPVIPKTGASLNERMRERRFHLGQGPTETAGGEG